MGNRRKSFGDRENSYANKLESNPIETENDSLSKELICLMPTGFSVPGYPNTPLSHAWIMENSHDIESLLATGLYYPVYKEELNNGTRTKSTSEDTNGEGDAIERDSRSVLYESESSGRDAE